MRALRVGRLRYQFTGGWVQLECAIQGWCAASEIEHLGDGTGDGIKGAGYNKRFARAPLPRFGPLRYGNVG